MDASVLLQFSRDSFSQCLAEEKLQICCMVDRALSGSIPLQYDAKQLADVLAFLQLRKLVLSNDNSSLFQQIAESSVTLLESNNRTESDQSKTLFDIFDISFSLLSDSNFSDYATSILCKLEKELSDVFTQLWSDISVTDVLKPRLHINLLSVVLKHALGRKTTSDLIGQSLRDLTLCLASCTVASISSLANTCLLPQLLAHDNQLQLATQLWNLIASQVNDQDGNILVERSSVFMLLCSVIEFYLPENESIPHLSILHKTEFWQLIQCGITHNDQVVRKQARYLLKRSIDFICSNNLIINSDYFKWDQSSSLEDWNKFFLILESLEEKQVHLVKPMFPLVEKSFHFLDMKWALCVLHRVINHDNNFIVKWGVSYFMNLPPVENTKLFTVHKLLPALNNSTLYQSEFGKLPEISRKLQEFFNDVALRQDFEFFRKLLRGLGCISWAPVPLFHVTQALGHLPTIPAWDESDLIVLKQYLVDATASQCVFIRATSQSMLLRAMLSLTDRANCDLAVIADALSAFSKAESFTRGLEDWTLTVEWLRTFVTSEAAETFLSTYLRYALGITETQEVKCALNTLTISRMMVLLCDAGLVNEDFFNTLMQLFTPHLNECETRLYICQKSVDTCLDVLVHIRNEIGSSEVEQNMQMLMMNIAQLSNSILSYLHMRLNSTLTIFDFHSVQLYASVLKILDADMTELTGKLREVLLTAINISNNNDSNLAVQKYFAAIIIEWCSICVCKWYREGSTKESPLQTDLESYLPGAIQCETLNLTCPRQEGMTRDLQTLWGHVASGQLRARWSALSNLLNLRDSNLHDTIKSATLIHHAMVAIEVGGREILPPVMGVVKFFLHMEADIEVIKSFINSTYTLSFEHRKTELFWLAIKEFIAMVFNSSMQQRDGLQEFLVQYVEDLHSRSQLVSGLFNIVVQQVINCDLYDSTVLRRILSRGMLFGPVIVKEQKIMYHTCKYIESLGHDIPANSLLNSQCNSSLDVRRTCINIMINSPHSALREHVACDIMVLECVRNGNKARCFADSQMHFNRLRAVQALLLLEHLLSNVNPKSSNLKPDKDLSLDLLQWSCSTLVEESHQPSVRYLLQWLITRLLLHSPALEDTFLTVMRQASRKRQGSMSSFISVLYLWVLGCIQNSKSELARVSELAMRLILPWAMAQHYNIRLYAQVALLRVWTAVHTFGLTQALETFAILEEGLQESLEQGCTGKNALSLQEDFYFCVFCPIQHFTLETIYYDLPRLGNVSQDEWIGPEFFISTNGSIIVNNQDDLLKNCKVAPWILKSSSSGLVMDEVEKEEDALSVVQRKVTPWKDMVPSHSSRENTRKESPNGLVVVASLVDKAPNLGGLARTCEVFGASELVLHNLKITEDMLFQTLSVSAEKWINISEVKAHELEPYLAFKKMCGYTLIAAEQTSNSVPLQEFTFPKKSLLLLGNEKSGIPAELLPLLDICVEVPQQGVVRSLNVHVTGGIFIWQYFQQHKLCVKDESGST